MLNKVGQVSKKTKVKSTKLVNTKHVNRPTKKSSDNVGNSDSHRDENSENESWSDASDNDVLYTLNESSMSQHSHAKELGKQDSVSESGSALRLDPKIKLTNKREKGVNPNGVKTKSVTIIVSKSSASSISMH